MERLWQSEHSGKGTNLTFSSRGAPGSEPPAPLDILCGTLRPLRWSAHCVVYYAEAGNMPGGAGAGASMAARWWPGCKAPATAAVTTPRRRTAT
jgi:hypothetical protein